VQTVKIILNVLLYYVERLAAVSLATAHDSRIVLKEVHKNKINWMFICLENNFLRNSISFK